MEKSIALKTLKILFPGVSFSPIPDRILEKQGSNLSKLDSFIDIEKYLIQNNGNWILDYQRMAETNPYSDLFPKNAGTFDKNYWKTVHQLVLDEKLKGGIPQPFIEEEDNKYIGSLNKSFTGLWKLKRSEDFSLPIEFFTNLLNNMGYYADYNALSKTFDFNFSFISETFKPNSVYNAYQRYAHSQYTKILLGTAKDANERNPQKLINNANTILVEKLGLGEKYKRSLSKLNNQERLIPVRTDSGELSLVSNVLDDALQDFPMRDPYAFKSLEEIIITIHGQYKKRMFTGPFDHNDVANISNAVNDICQYLPDDKAEILKNEGILKRVEMLKQIIADSSVSNKISKRRKETINKLYSKAIAAKAPHFENLINESGDDKSEISIGDTFKLSQYLTPEQEFFLNIDRQYLIALVEEEFAENVEFILKIRQFINNESQGYIEYSFGQYRLKGSHNTESELYKLFREEKGIDIKEPDARQGHTNFAIRIRSIIDKYFKETAEE